MVSDRQEPVARKTDIVLYPKFPEGGKNITTDDRKVPSTFAIHVISFET